MSLSPAAARAFAAALVAQYGAAGVAAALVAKPAVFSPNPGPQQQAFDSQADELFFGGAAGGGKSYLLCGLPILQHRNTLLLRRRATDARALSGVLKGFGFGDWRSNGAGGTLTTPDGREVEVGGCQHPDDWKKYQGVASDLIGFDELAHFTEKMYTTLIGWNRVRRPERHPHQRCRVVGAGNPPTDAAGEWVIRRWAPWLDPTAGRKAAPGELRWFAMIDNKDTEVDGPDPVTHKGRTLVPKSRTFIPAKLEDNPALLATGYGAMLDAFPEPYRSMLRDGRFDVARSDDRWQLIPTAWVLAAFARHEAHAGDKLPPLDRLGMDVATSPNPGDQTVIAPLHGVTIPALDVCPGSETQTGPAALARMLRALTPNPKAIVNLDTNGAGRSCYDSSQQSSPRMANVKEFVGSREANYRDPHSPPLRFLNLRAASYWHLRQWLNPDCGKPEDRLRLPRDPELLADLTAPRYWIRSGNVVYVESKEEWAEGKGLRARLGRSPDKGDAVAMACWKPASPVFHSA